MKKINTPIAIKVKDNKVYFWCSCGKSAQQPFCDGSHKNTKFSPVKLESLKNEELHFCGCKETNNPPFCDGSHLKFTEGIKFKMYKNLPFKKSVKNGQTYFWCSCGKSAQQPFCDGSHNKTKRPPINLIVKIPKKYIFADVRKVKTHHFVIVLINH
jgi:CDGSH-type Zn-finger protein